MSSRSTPPPSPLRKRPRLSREEAREALLEAGRQLLFENGLDTGLGLVSLNDAVQASGVPRASAYRLFENDELDPQEAFRIELLISYIEQDPLDERRDAMLGVLDSALTLLGSDDPVDLATGLREAIRLSFAGKLAPLADDPNWGVAGPSMAITAMNDWAPQQLVDAHRAGLLAHVRWQRPLLQAAISAAGLRLRPEFDWDAWGLLVASGPIAHSFLNRYFPDLNEIERPTGPDGELQVWGHAAMLAEGLARTTLEPDPDAPVSADLSTWD